jgi:hypothetical protein
MLGDDSKGTLPGVKAAGKAGGRSRLVSLFTPL